MSSATPVKYKICHRCLPNDRGTRTLPRKNVLLKCHSNSGCSGDPGHRQPSTATVHTSRSFPQSQNRGRELTSSLIHIFPLSWVLTHAPEPPPALSTTGYKQGWDGCREKEPSERTRQVRRGSMMGPRRLQRRIRKDILATSRRQSLF